MHETAIIGDDSGNLPPIGHVARNASGGMYEPGRNFSRLKWHVVIAFPLRNWRDAINAMKSMQCNWHDTIDAKQLKGRN